MDTVSWLRFQAGRRKKSGSLADLKPVLSAPETPVRLRGSPRGALASPPWVTQDLEAIGVLSRWDGGVCDGWGRDVQTQGGEGIRAR